MALSFLCCLQALSTSTLPLSEVLVAVQKKEGEMHPWAGVGRLGLSLIAEIWFHCFGWRWRTWGLLFRMMYKRLRKEREERIKAKK